MGGRGAAVGLNARAAKFGMGPKDAAVYVIEIGFMDIRPVLGLIGLRFFVG